MWAGRSSSVAGVVALAVWAGALAGCSDSPSAPVTAGGIAGAVRAGSTGVGGATLTLSGGASRTATSAASGSYSFTDLVPGAYVVTIAPPAGFELGAGEVAAKNATVTAGQSATVNFALAAVSGGNVQVINVSGITFSPASVTIARGTTVRWVNGTTVFHTVTPDGNTEWTSANLGAGTQFEHTFNTAGTFNYFCTPHHSLGMTGTIIVQ